MTLNFNLQGKERKPLVLFIAQTLETKEHYTGVKGKYAYQIGEYMVDQNGTLTGPDNRELAGTLEANGFTAESMEFDTTEDATVEETVLELRRLTHG